MEADYKKLERFSADIRITLLKELSYLGSGHVGGSASIADVLAVLYGAEMNVDPENPQNPDRDRLVLSKGHCGPALYATLALKGFFPMEWLKTLNKGGTKLPSHSDMRKTPGIDMSTGSLGQGISCAEGIALGLKMQKKDGFVYCIIGDGEMQEGQVWEAAMSAAKYALDNLCAIVDVNGLQIDGATKDVMPSEPLDAKFAAFGWNVIHVDGHDYAKLLDAFAAAAQCKGKPTVLLAKTVKGKGVSFMENNAGWHGKAPNDEQFAAAKAELEAKIAELEGK